MVSASVLRLQIESALAHRIPSALTPPQKIIRPTVSSGIEALDEILQGGFPLGAITELAGPECSGRTSIALSFLARITYLGKVCAWVDVADALDPVSAAAAGVNLDCMLWVRCGVAEKLSEPRAYKVAIPENYLTAKEPKKGLHGGSFGPHPRTEVRGISEALGNLFSPRCAEPQPRVRPPQQPLARGEFAPGSKTNQPLRTGKPWTRMEQALRTADLLLQAGGFSAIMMDMGGLAPEFVTRVPLATWFRYRAAAEKAQTCLLLLTQHPCAKSSAELLLRLEAAEVPEEGTTIFTGMRTHVEVVRRRFTYDQPQSLKKPAQNSREASWQSRTSWAGSR